VNIGISIEDNIMYLAGRPGENEKPYYYKSPFYLINSENEIPSGYVWDRVADEESIRNFMEAEKIALVIPAAVCYTKQITLEKYQDRDPDKYRTWIAGNLLPGDLSNYIYGFIPLGTSSVEEKAEVLFYATISDQFWPHFYAVIKDENYDRTCLLPEYVALSYLLRNSIGAVTGVQAGMINVGAGGAAAVFVKDDTIFSNRYFPVKAGGIDELKTDLETYFLSLIDPEKQTELFIAGKQRIPSLQLGSETRIRFNSMSAGFISALGSADYVSAGGKCELPAGD
jgi:hypothetical protein